MEQLKVGIGADTKGLEKGLKDAEKALNTFATRSKQIESQLKKNAIQSSKLGAEISKLELDYKKGTISQSDFGKGMLKLTNAEKTLSNESKVLRNDLAKLNASTRDLGTKGMGTMKKGMVSGSSASIAFSRTIQDMPFGIMGVSNNITNLTEQFGYLKKQTGSAGGALKAMLRDMKGFGGITLLISLATSAWLMYSQSQRGATKQTNELVDAQKDLIGSTMQEISSVNTLLSIAKNENESKRRRELAVKKLQELYPKYLGNITLEGINTAKTKESVDKLTQSLIQQAKVKGAQSRLSDLYSKRFEVENKKATEQISIMRTLWVGVKNFGNVSKSAMEGAAIATNNQKNELSELDKEIAKVNGSITKLISTDFDIDKIFGGKTKLLESFQAETVIPIINELDIFGNKIKDSLNNANLNLQGQGIDWAAAYNAQQQLEEQLKLENNLMKLNENLSNIVNQGISQTLSGIGNAIGTALSSGANIADAIGNVLLGSLGGILTQVGQMAIAIGIGLEAIQIALKSLNPFVAIAAGIALVALGSYFSSQSQAIGNSMGSGGSSSSGGGGSYSAPNVGSGYSAPSSSGGYSGSSNGGTVVFEIAGQKLVGVLSNTLSRNRNLGGTLTIT